MAEGQQQQHHHPTAAGAESSSPMSVALIVGVTGITGLSLVETLRSPAVSGAPWTVYGVARRDPPSWYPFSSLDGFLRLDVLDPSATLSALSPLARQVTHLFWVASAATIPANVAMLSNVLRSLSPSATRPSALRHVAVQTGSMHYLPRLPAADRRPTTPAPFREDSPRGSHPHFYYALEDVVASHSPRLRWTVHRPSVILGASARSEHNLVLTLAAYALICRREGSSLAYPGNEFTWQNPCCDATDAGMLAEQQIWAATAAENEAFNCTNGDVFAWSGVWEAVATEFGVGRTAGGGEGEEWVRRMKGKGAVWEAIVVEEGLAQTRLEEIANFEYVHAITNFEFEMVSCTMKSRAFGFHRRVDTMESVRRWISRLREMNIIPKH